MYNIEKNINLKVFSLIAFVFILFAGRTGSIPIYGEYFILNFGMLATWFLFSILFIKSNAELKINSIILMFLLFIISMLVSGFSGNITSYSYRKIIESLFYLLPLLLIIMVLFKKDSDYITFFKITYLISIVLAYLAIITSFINGSIFTGRMSVLGGGPITFSRIMIFGLISALVLINVEKDKKYLFSNFGYLLNCLTLISAIALSGSRQSFLGMFLCIIIFIFIISLKVDMKRKMKIFLISVISIMLLIMLIILLPNEFIINSTIYNRLLLFFDENKGSSVDVRTEMISYALSNFKNHIFRGYGIGSFQLFNSLSIMYPHNIFAEVAFEMGLLGLIPLVLTIVIPHLYLIRFMFIKRKSIIKGKLTIVSGVYTAFIFAIYTAQISGDIFDNRWIWFYAILLICLIRNKNRGVYN
jgi:O-antigen ligase